MAYQNSTRVNGIVIVNVRRLVFFWRRCVAHNLHAQTLNAQGCDLKRILASEIDIWSCHKTLGGHQREGQDGE
jgi:hypothetical protein